MIDLIPYVLTLLAISFVAMYFIIRVLAKQIYLYKKYQIKDKDIAHFRNILFAISLTIIAMGILPIAINLFTLFNQMQRPTAFTPLSFVYTIGVHLHTLLLSYLLWRIYSLANGDFNDKCK